MQGTEKAREQRKKHRQRHKLLAKEKQATKTALDESARNQISVKRAATELPGLPRKRPRLRSWQQSKDTVNSTQEPVNQDKPTTTKQTSEPQTTIRKRPRLIRNPQPGRLRKRPRLSISSSETRKRPRENKGFATQENEELFGQPTKKTCL